MNPAEEIEQTIYEHLVDQAIDTQKDVDDFKKDHYLATAKWWSKEYPDITQDIIDKAVQSAGKRAIVKRKEEKGKEAKELKKLAADLEQMSLFPETQIPSNAWYFFPETLELIKKGLTPEEVFDQGGARIAFELRDLEEVEPHVFEPDVGIMIRIFENDEVDPPTYHIVKDDGYDLGVVEDIAKQHGGVPADYVINDTTKKVINDWLIKYDADRTIP